MFLVLCVVLTQLSCKKHKALVPDCPPPTDTVKPKISFVFVNRLGYKQDTNSTRWFQFVNLYSKFYNPQSNSSNLVQTIYNRYNPLIPLIDSIIHIKNNNMVGAQYAYEIRLAWYYHAGIQFAREMRFNTKNWPNACDTIEVAKDTIIKFVYPDDTLPNNRFVRIL
jgi:hypothetical protein